MRVKLRDRRDNTTLRVKWVQASGHTANVLMTVGINETGQIKELFCADFKTGSDQIGIITDACVLISQLLQHGATPKELVDGMSKPYSLVGYLIEALLVEQNRLDKQLLMV